MPVDVEILGGDDARLDPAPSEPSAEIGRVQLGHHRLELATQRLHARSPVRPDERPELRSTKVLGRLDRRLSEQCHEQQAECHRPHSEDDRTGKREAPACRVHEPECLDRREVESEPHVTAPRVLRKCGWWVEAIRLEGTILTELWLDESTRRAARTEPRHRLALPRLAACRDRQGGRRSSRRTAAAQPSRAGADERDAGRATATGLLLSAPSRGGPEWARSSGRSGNR